jgi:alpha-L-fucosidase
MAVKEVFFTKKGSTVYAIVPRFPEKSLRINDMPVTSSTKVTLLGTAREFDWKKSGNGIIVNVPAMSVNEIPAQEAYVFKITFVSE